MKNRYSNRKRYTDEEIDIFINKVDGFKSLFSDKKFISEKTWKNDIVRQLDEESCNLFFYKLHIKKNGNTICKNKLCDNILKYDSFSYKAGYKFFNQSGFRKYCPKCVKQKVWMYKKYNDKDYNYINKKISCSRYKFLNSKKGKEYCKSVGLKNSKNMKRYFLTNKGKEQIKKSSEKTSKILKDKILRGLFTPNITNSFTHWTSKIDVNGSTKKFRSSWEACFWLSNNTLEYESLRVPYIDSIGNNKTVIVDFIDESNNIVYEIKPKKYFLIQKEKMDAIVKYCIRNTLKFKWINEYNIMKYIDESKFSGENKKQLLKMKKGIICKN